MRPQPNDHIVRPTPMTPSSAQNQQPLQQAYQQPYQQSYQQQQHSQYQLQDLQPWSHHQHPQQTAQNRAPAQGSPLAFTQQTQAPELPPRPALYFAPPPPPVPPYNPGQHQTPDHAHTSQPSSSSAGQPLSFEPFSTPSQDTLGQKPPSSVGGIGRIGASLSGLIQAKVQGYLAQVQASQASTGDPQTQYPGSISGQQQLIHTSTTDNQHVQPSINSGGTDSSHALPAHQPSPSPYPHNQVNPASPWLVPGRATAPYPSPSGSTAVQASSGGIAGATPSLVVPPALQPQPGPRLTSQADAQLNAAPAVQSGVYPAVSTPETSLNPTLPQPTAPAFQPTGSVTPSPQVRTASTAQPPGTIPPPPPPPTAQVQPIMLVPAVTVASIPPQQAPTQPPGQGQTQQHPFVPPVQESQVPQAPGQGQTFLVSAPHGPPITPTVSAASPTPAPSQTSNPAPRPIAPRASKLRAVTNLASKLQQKLILEAGTTTSNIHDALNSGSDHINEDEYNELPMLEGPMRASGPPGTVSRLCFNKIKPMHEKEWYVHPEAPDFLICSWCYHHYIRNSPFASAFSTIRKIASCSFHYPRMTKCLWPEAIRTRSLIAVTAFMSTNAEVPGCKGSEGAVMKDHVKWFVAADDEIPTFVACEACYEGIIMATSFRGRFIPSPQAQGPNDKWTCDMSLEFMWRTLLRESRRNNWPGFVEGANKRMAMEECKRQPKSANRSKWFCVRGESPQLLRICETCHADDFLRSRFEGIFEEVKEEPPETKHSVVKCDWKFNLPLAEFAFSCTVSKRSPDELRAGIVAIASKPRCGTKEGITGGKWYNFPRPIGNFGICEACYIGFMESTVETACLSPKPTVIPSAAYCIFNVFVNRWAEYIDLYNEALDIGVLSGYEDHARKWASINPCVRKTAVSGRAWYGWPDCPICPDCYETFVVGTKLAATLPLQNSYSDDKKVCCMYSPRQRERYTEACTAGNPDKLLEASRERQAIWQQTIPVLMELKERVDAELEAAAVQRQISATYMCSDMMGSVSGSNTYVYGSGGYKSWDGVLSDQAWNSAMAMQQRAANPARIQEMVRLENIWAQYE
ncbi:hypothetical protein ACJ41O_009258 [Fusarium nematophilum]